VVRWRNRCKYVSNVLFVLDGASTPASLITLQSSYVTAATCRCNLFVSASACQHFCCITYTVSQAAVAQERVDTNNSRNVGAILTKFYISVSYHCICCAIYNNSVGGVFVERVTVAMLLQTFRAFYESRMCKTPVHSSHCTRLQSTAPTAQESSPQLPPHKTPVHSSHRIPLNSVTNSMQHRPF
jgi:hypothetical protein